MKPRLYIALIIIGMLALILSITYRYTLKKYFQRTRDMAMIEKRTIHRIGEAEMDATSIKPEIEEHIVMAQAKKSMFKEVAEYIKEILGSISSIVGFILFLLEKRKKAVVNG